MRSEYDHYLKVQDVMDMIIEKYKNKEFDANGNVALYGVSFVADKNEMFHKPSEDYIRRESEWYHRMSLNVYDIPGIVPKIWRDCAAEDGTIISNYGWMLFSEENGFQFTNAIRSIKRDPNSRQAIAIFMRPSMHKEWNKDGRHDFCCTYCYNFQYDANNNTLNMIVNMRSNDAATGYTNDVMWAKEVFAIACNELEAEMGVLVWRADNFHVYPRSFHELDEYIEKQEKK